MGPVHTIDFVKRDVQAKINDAIIYKLWTDTLDKVVSGEYCYYVHPLGRIPRPFSRLGLELL